MWQVSTGAIDMAKSNLQNLLAMCAKPIPADKVTDELLAAQKNSFKDVTYELVRQVTSPNKLVRETVRNKFCKYFSMWHIISCAVDFTLYQHMTR